MENRWVMKAERWCESNRVRDVDASIMCGRAAAQALNWHQPFLWVHALDNSLKNHKQIKFLIWLPQLPRAKHFSLPPSIFPLGAHYIRSLWSLPKPCSSVFELTNLASAWEPQSFPPIDPNKHMCPGPALPSWPASCLDLPVEPFEVRPLKKKIYTVTKNKTSSWLWPRSWTPYCQL